MKFFYLFVLQGKDSNFVVNKVCGSDGTTYASECDLKKTSCLSQKFITVNFEGDCCECIF